MHVVTSIFFVENFAIPRHEHRYRIRQQEHPGGNRASHAIGSRVPDTGILQVDGIHQMVQCHMCVAATHARKKRSDQTGKGDQWITAECTEKKVEPHHIGLQLPQRAQEPDRVSGIVEGPAAHDRKSIEFRLAGRDLVRKYGEIQKRIAIQLLRNMQSILAQAALAWRESGHQTDFHEFESLMVVPLR